MATQTYGSGWDYDFEAALRQGRVKSYWSGWGSPTAEELYRHAEKFGSECVQQTADLFGVNMKVKPEDPNKLSKQRKTTRNLKDDVLDLHARGMLPEAIADVLNVSDRRVKALLRDV